MEQRKPRVLYADENRGNCEFVVRDLTEYDVTCATTPTETLQMGISGGFDLILLDSRLTGMTGIEVCRKIRAYDGQTPILILSGPDEAVVRAKALAAGAQDYWPSPVDLYAVGRELRGLIKIKMGFAAGVSSPSQDTWLDR